MSRKKVDSDIKYLLEPHELDELREEEEEEMDVAELSFDINDRSAERSARARRTIEDLNEEKRYQNLLDDEYDDFFND